METTQQFIERSHHSSYAASSPRRLNSSQRVFSNGGLPGPDEIEFVSSEAINQVHELEAQRDSLLAEMKELKRRRHQNEIGIWKTTNQLDEGNRLAVDLARKCEILDRENAAKSNSLKGARRDYNRAEKEVSEQERFSEQMSRQLLDIKAEIIRTKPHILSARKQLGVVETEKDRVVASVGRMEREYRATSSRMNELTRHSAELTRTLQEAVTDGNLHGCSRKPFGAAAR